MEAKACCVLVLYILAALLFPQRGIPRENQWEEKAMGEGPAENIHRGITFPEHIQVSLFEAG